MKHSLIRTGLPAFLSICGLFILASLPAKAQYYYRIECEISIKNKIPDGEGVLILGKAYYDKNISRMVYDIRFPEKEVWVVQDTTVTIHKNGETERIRGVAAYNQSTIFHKILEGRLNNYGLEGTVYAIQEVERDGDLVITTWAPTRESQALGKIYTSTLDDELFGVVFQNPSGEVIGRQLFRNYTLVRGMKVPTEIVQVFYKDGAEEYQLFSLSNIKINNPGNENMYHYPAAGN